MSEWIEDTYIVIADPYSKYALIDQNPLWIAQATFHDLYRDDNLIMDLDKMGDPHYNWHVDNMQEYINYRPDLSPLMQYMSNDIKLQKLEMMKNIAMMNNECALPMDATKVHIPVLRRK